MITIRNSDRDPIMIDGLFFSKVACFHGCTNTCQANKVFYEFTVVRTPLLTFNSFGAKFQATFVVCCFILANYRLERRLYVKLKD